MPAIALLGATGRMGRALVHAIAERPDMKISGALASAASRHLGSDAGTAAGAAALGVTITSDIGAALQAADVAIDFALPGNLSARAHAVVAARCNWVLGATGMDEAQRAAVNAASQRVAVIASPNMSIGVQVLLRLADAAARGLPPDFDIEVFEAHHRDKIDAPSGTARRLGEVLAEARGTQLAAVGEFGRATAPGPRKVGSIGFSVARGGDIVGEHRVTFAGRGEQLVLEHRATDRMAFARGAVAAAAWLAGRAPGLYQMSDIVFMK
jgi:4-hydroxy-tetrahydrodipicolinate reductase